MGQQEVYDFLKKRPKEWFSARDIAGKLKISLNSARTSLARLKKSKFIVCKQKEKKNVLEYKMKL